MNEKPQPGLRVEGLALQVMHRLDVGESAQMNGGREVIERITEDRWLLSAGAVDKLNPIAYLGRDGSRVNVIAEVPAILPSAPVDRDPAEDFQRWMHWGSVTRDWTQQDAKDFIDGFIDGMESAGINLQPPPHRPWWRRIFRH